MRVSVVDVRSNTVRLVAADVGVPWRTEISLRGADAEPAGRAAPRSAPAPEPTTADG